MIRVQVVLDLLKAAEDPTIGEGPTRRVAVLYGGLHLMVSAFSILARPFLMGMLASWCTILFAPSCP